MINIDFFDYNSVLLGLPELYEIDENKVLMMAVEAQCEENPTAAFIEAADIKLDSVDISQVSMEIDATKAVQERLKTTINIDLGIKR